jgi:hypothetical protein
MNKPIQMLRVPEPSHEWEEFFDALIQHYFGGSKASRPKKEGKPPEAKRTADEYRYRCDSGHAL